jgi:hypothetical protein
MNRRDFLKAASAGAVRWRLGRRAAAQPGRKTRIAAEAGVQTLVLSHFVPENHPDGDRAWLQAGRPHFGGEVILGKDLLEL